MSDKNEGLQAALDKSFKRNADLEKQLGKHIVPGETTVSLREYTVFLCQDAVYLATTLVLLFARMRVLISHVTVGNACCTLTTCYLTSRGDVTRQQRNCRGGISG